jgi:tRNA (guanine-N7-)-methyltransferase
MGRRSIPKYDRTLSLEGFYSELADISLPWHPDRFFGRAAPLEIEIGSGKGLFLMNASTARPDCNFLGLEIAIKYARLAAYRLAVSGNSNARLIRGDAMRFLAEYLPDLSVSAFHVYFPDPWWKERHRRRRVMQPSTIEAMKRTLMPGGMLHFWTDVEEYFESVCELMAGFPAFSPPCVVEESPAVHDMDYRTHFERRMRLNDHPVFRAHFVFSGTQANRSL